MRVNIYAEEMTNRIEIIAKTVDGQEFTGCRFYLELPVTVGGHGQHRSEEGPMVFPPLDGKPAQVAGPFIHRPGDDDSSAVTFWGKRDLRAVLGRALELLDKHYKEPLPVGAADPPGIPHITTVRCAQHVPEAHHATKLNRRWIDERTLEVEIEYECGGLERRIYRSSSL